jgi:hypothetical protein
MLTARIQLDRVEELLAEFTRNDGEMRPLALYQAQHLAMLAMLRSVGHVLDKVDADTPARKKWLDERWSHWKREAIFREFIDFARNRLLKEFRGGIDANDPAIVAKGAVADPVYPAAATLLVAVDVDRLRTADGANLLVRLREAIAYWRRNLSEAEAAFETLR